MPNSNLKSIAIRLEGGLGDCILGVRFIPAIKEAHPEALIRVFVDSEGKTFQRDALSAGFAHLWDSIEVIPSKKHKEYWIESQFGRENYYGGLGNVPDEYTELFKKHDKFYNLHTDSWDPISYDFDWLRYFYFFPRPHSIRGTIPRPENYIVTHLVSSSSVGHRLDKFYITGLIKNLLKIAPVMSISTPDTNHFYSDVQGEAGFTLLNAPVEEIFPIIENAKLMVSTDSGFKYLAYCYSVPTLEFSQQSQQPHSCIPSHRMRWNLFPERCFPLNFNFNHVARCAANIYKEKGYALLPNIQDFDRELIRRIHKP